MLRARLLGGLEVELNGAVIDSPVSQRPWAVFAYLALAPKSNAIYEAYGAVQRDVEETAAQPVPLHLRNAPTGLMKGLGYGSGYQYAHDIKGKVADMQCLPDNLRDRVYYHPTAEGVEKRIRDRMEDLKRRRAEARNSEGKNES